MSEPTKHEKRTFTLGVVTLIVNVMVSLITALIGAGFLVSKAEVLVETAPVEKLELETVYTAPEDGFVLVTPRAGPDNRAVGVRIEVDGILLGETGAQDSYVTGVPSISATTMTIPVKKGSEWKIFATGAEKKPESIQGVYVSFQRDWWPF